MKISIIIPIYQVESYLEECLQSVIKQTYLNLDIVLIEDGGSDKSLEIAMSYARMDERIFLVTKPNGGLSSARNLGLELIKGTKLRTLLEENINTKLTPNGGGGDDSNLTSIQKNSLNQSKIQISTQNIIKHFKKIENRIYKFDLAFINDLITQELPKRWIHFLDSDDYLRLDCLQKCMDARKSMHNLEIITHGVELFYESSGNFDKVYRTESKKSHYKSGLEYLVDNNFYIFCFVYQGIFTTSILNRYGLRFSDRIFHEDHDFGTILFALSKGVLHENFEGLVYRQREGSIMAGYNEVNFPSTLPSNLAPLKEYFQSYKDLRDYFKAYSLLVVAANLSQFENESKLNKKAKKLFNESKKFYIHSYIRYYWNLNLMPTKTLLEALNMPNLAFYRRINMLRAATKKLLKIFKNFLNS